MMINPAGGLVYHWRAMWHSRVLWSGFRGALAQWLGEWNPPERELLIVGPSAGYSLTAEFLNRFDRVICVDPDRLAELLFQARHRLQSVEWVRKGVFLDGLGSFSKLLDENPKAAVLFCNFLGQLKLLFDDETEAERVRAVLQVKLRGVLEGRSWASFHDRLSGKIKPLEDGLQRMPARLCDDEVLARFYPRDAKGELIDHETEGFLPEDREHCYFTWQLAPGRWHLIEGVRGRKS